LALSPSGITPSRSLIYASFGFAASQFETLTLRQGNTTVRSINIGALPSICAHADNLTSILNAMGTSHDCAVLHQSEANQDYRITLFATLPENTDISDLQYSLTVNATSKVRSEGGVGGMHMPSVSQWIRHIDSRLHANTNQPHGFTEVALGLMAFAGLPHADFVPKGFDFLNDELHFDDYLQATAAYHASLGTTQGQAIPNRLRTLWQTTQGIMAGDLIDPVQLEMKTPADNVLFADGYTRLEFETSFTGAWQNQVGTQDLKLLLKASKNIELWVNDRSQGFFAFKPLLPANTDTLPADLSGSGPIDTNGFQITLPMSGPILTQLLQHGIYARGSSSAVNDEPFHLGVRVIRDNAEGLSRVDIQTTTVDFLPSAGKVISGPERSAFQIWPVDGGLGQGGVTNAGALRYVKSAKYGHYMNRGQVRALAYAQEYGLGTGFKLSVGGVDAEKLTTVSSQSMGEGKDARYVTLVKSGGGVGTGMNGLLFRAMDYRVDGNDTTVLRVFERKGSLFGLGLVVPSAGQGGSPEHWPVVVDRDAVAPVGVFYAPGVGLPTELGEAGVYEVWIDDNARLYSSLATQEPSTRLSDKWFEVKKTDSKKRSYYSFDLSTHYGYSNFYHHQFGVSHIQALVQGGESKKSFKVVFRPKGESARYLQEEVVSTFKPVNCRARIAGDLVRGSGEDKDQINSRDFEADYPHVIKHWFTTYSPESLQKNGIAGANNYKVTMDMVPIKLVRPSANGYQFKLHNATKAHLFSKVLPSDFLLNRAYLFDSLTVLQILADGRIRLTMTAPDRSLELSVVGDTLSMIVTGNKVCNGNLYARVENDGLSANTDSLNIVLTDFNKQYAIYTARYKRESNQLDQLAKEEGIEQYLWEDGKKLSDPLYDEGTYLQFPVKPLHRYAGRDFARISDFDSDSGLVVFTHGFNSPETMGGTFDTEQTFFKKLRLQGFMGNFLAFHWYGDFNPKYSSKLPVVGDRLTMLLDAMLFAQDQLNAFKTSSAFLSLLADTLSQFKKKSLLVHSLGNQVALDMLRQNAAKNPLGNAPDIGIEKYTILEAALAKSVMDAEDTYSGDRKYLRNWQGLYKDIPSQYPNMDLYHLRRNDDQAVWLFYRANEMSKGIPILMETINNLAMLADAPSNSSTDNRVFECPLPFSLPFFEHARRPRDLAICFTAAGPSELVIRTFPQNGLTETEWFGRIEDEVESQYNARNWKTANSHSWLNLDEAYKTKEYVSRILE
jgi:hypothetical protein